MHPHIFTVDHHRLHLFVSTFFLNLCKVSTDRIRRIKLRRDSFNLLQGTIVSEYSRPCLLASGLQKVHALSGRKSDSFRLVSIGAFCVYDISLFCIYNATWCKAWNILMNNHHMALNQFFQKLILFLNILILFYICMYMLYVGLCMLVSCLERLKKGTDVVISCLSGCRTLVLCKNCTYF